jgi:hypothetical protein
VGRGVDRAVATLVGVAVALGVGLTMADAVEEGAGGDGLQTGEDIAVGPHVGIDGRGEGPSDAELEAGPHPTVTKAAARISLPTERRTAESRVVMRCSLWCQTWPFGTGCSGCSRTSGR